MPVPQPILVVDDDPSVRDVLAEYFREEGYRCEVARDGLEALEKLRGRGFDLVVSDIDMPRMDGVALLREIKSVSPDTEIILLTGILDVDTAIRSMRLGACDYLTKPFNLSEVCVTVERALDKQRLTRENREYHEALEARVEERTAQLKRKSAEIDQLYQRLIRTYQTTLEALAIALDTRDSETLGHSVRVAAYTAAVARRMGVVEPELTDIYRGALLHDVGKIGVPDAILRKPGRLTPEEWIEMRKHPEIGDRILQGIDFLDGARPIVLSHQERYDGKGYPLGLRGKEIPLGARIFAVVDTLDAMTSDRPYRKALPMEAVFEEIRKFRGSQFDPDVVDAFLGIPRREWDEIRIRVLEEVRSRGGGRF
jgi:putative nucleotidyltransferase with HDIG domain